MDDSSATVGTSRRKGLGEMLVEVGMLSSEQLERALDLQAKNNCKLSEILLEQKMVTGEDMAMALSLQLNMPLIDLKLHIVDPDTLRLVPERTARKHTLIPLDVVANSLVVVMADPGDIRAIEDVAAQSKMRIEPAVGIPSDIQEAINLNYKVSGEIEKEMSQFAPRPESTESPTASISEDIVAQTPIVRTVDLLIAQALKQRCSDIHIEPQEDRLRVRYRIDGVLRDAMSLPTTTLEPLVSRVKIMADMNITEKRRPQDGMFPVRVEGKDADVSVATYETAYGETVVMRLLDKSFSLFELPELGFLPDSLKKYREILTSPFGMILITGPTGSGKTTTLYASIGELDRKERNIITIEDPIEYRFADIKQTQVNIKAGLTFATGLRALMRLDPDVILVGEIRDTDTAKTAVQAALTGHLVLSSIHANDTVGVLFRLMDLGVEPFLISSALVGVVAQRMIRRICPHCRERYTPPEDQLHAYSLEFGDDTPTFFHGFGCNLCGDTGYLKRTGVFEILRLSADIRRLLLAGAGPDELRAQALQEGMITLRHDGMLKVKEGGTTVQEVMRNVFSIG